MKNHKFELNEIHSENCVQNRLFAMSQFYV